MARLTMTKLIVGSALAAWACSKPAPIEDGDDTLSSGGTGARGGSGAQAGAGGSTAATGGSATGGSATGGSATGGSATGGSSATGGTIGDVGGSAGSGGTSALGGSPAAAGRASGGANATGGVGATGGATGAGGATSAGGNATGGSSTAGGSAGGTTGAGGNASGGSGTAGGATTGGTGGLPNDPNWIPPDMTATAKLVVLYQAQQTATSATDVRFDLTLKNQSDTAIDMKNVTIRYWMSSEPSPQLRVDYSSAGLKCTGAPEFVPNNANSYLEFSFSTGGTLPAYVDQNSLNDGKINAALQSKINNVKFNQANDWSFKATPASATANPKITAYDGDVLIWGCEPDHTCAMPEEPSGTGGEPAI